VTCIVGVVDEGKVFIGADSLAAASWMSVILPTKKVFRIGEMVMGVAGMPRAIQLLRFALKPPTISEDIERYVSITLVDAVRSVFKEAGFTEIENSAESYDGKLMIGVRGRLFAVDGYFQVIESTLPYLCIGSGAQVASGSLFTTAKSGMPTRKRILTALKASASIITNVGGPFHIMETK